MHVSTVEIFKDGPWRSLTCICPTYGRFGRVRDAIACFILQDYPGEKKLCILNDAEVPLALMEPGDSGVTYKLDDKTSIEVVNKPHFETVGKKKQWLADNVGTELTSHWEDDDLYLPSHLTTTVCALRGRPGSECARSFQAWRMKGVIEKLGKCERRTGRYDGGMVFYTRTSVPYLDTTRSIEASLIKDYWQRSVMHSWHPPVAQMTYVYRIYDGARHLCRSGKEQERTRRSWESFNRDFGGGCSLLPSQDKLGKLSIVDWARNQVGPYFCHLTACAELNYGEDVANKITQQMPWILEEPQVNETEQEFWKHGDKRWYNKMRDRHKGLWRWVIKCIGSNKVTKVIEVGGSFSEIPYVLPADGEYLNIDIKDSRPKKAKVECNLIVDDFRNIDPTTLPECDLLLAAAVVEHCKNFDEFLEWALKVPAKRILASFFNRLNDEPESKIHNKGPIQYYNQYSRKQLEDWLKERDIPYAIHDLRSDHLLEIIPMNSTSLYNARLALAKKMKVQIRHDPLQLEKLFHRIEETLPHRMIEVGSFRGGTALVFAAALKEPREMLLIDLCDRPKARPLLDKSIARLRKEGAKVEFFDGDSAGLEVLEVAEKFGMVDALYIDGSHKTPMVIHDYMRFRHFVKDGGIIGFHDVAHPKLVKRAWEYMTAAWSKQGLKHYILGGDEYDRKTRPWATGIGVLEWKRSALEDKESEARLQEIVGMVDKGKKA